MNYSEDELIPISALQHFVFCERQCALIHVEQAWNENRLTAEGRILHEHVHEADNESRGAVYIARGLRLRSLRLGLVGIADVVEFHKTPSNDNAVALPSRRGWWRPFPIEHKRGKPKSDYCDEVQLCAQALCLEEMLGCRIGGGALFYGRIRRRQEVAFTDLLRAETENAACRVHALIDTGKTPSAAYTKKCRQCSLMDICMPGGEKRKQSVRAYLREMATCEST